MDVSSSKRGVGAQKKRPVTALKDTSGSRDGTGSGTGTGTGTGTVQLCNRVGCCGRVNNSKGNKSKCLEKPKTLKPSLRLSPGKDVAPSSSKSCASNVKKPVIGLEKKPASKIERVPTKPQTPVVSVVQKVNASKTCTQVKLKSANSVSLQNSELNNGTKKRFTPGESSSSGKGKNVIRVPQNDTRVSDPRSSRNLISCRTSGVSSVKTRRPLNLDRKTGSSNQRNRDNRPIVQSNESSFSPELSESSSNDGGSRSDTSSTMVSVSSTDRSIARFVNDNGARNYNIDGIADVLLALDRMEQDEELTYEQLLSLEANLFLGGLSFYDQHRDMRMDIDNMSYEELLVLEEKMGTVSTALSEEELLKCIKISVYESLQLEDGRTMSSSGADDSKCSICQEEFVRGDKLGKLLCGHGYHAPCINQWLQLKNWCPICKSSPKPSSSHNA